MPHDGPDPTSIRRRALWPPLREAEKRREAGGVPGLAPERLLLRRPPWLLIAFGRRSCLAAFREFRAIGWSRNGMISPSRSR